MTGAVIGWVVGVLVMSLIVWLMLNDQPALALGIVCGIVGFCIGALAGE